ncbi:MAG TPA: ATP-binding cassette domain-containing protein [Polyangiaceae bacterium]|nr:ATP-binding cassette domain-containing protein [Polyangiaceae bacterium]
MAAALEAKSLQKSFRRRLRTPGIKGLLRSYLPSSIKTHDAVKDLDFRVEEGETLALIGPNGAGKSTTIKMLPLRFGNVAGGLVTLIIAIVVDEIVSMGISLTSFWVDDTSGLHLIYRRVAMILGGAFIPLDAYPEWLARICRATPFRHLVGGPARLFVGGDGAAWVPLAIEQLSFGAGALVVTLLVFHFGKKRLGIQGG